MSIKVRQADIYFIGYICFLISFILSVSQLINEYQFLENLRTLLRGIGYICCLYKLLSIKLSKKNILIIAFFFIIVVLSRLITGIDSLLVDFLLISTIQGVDKDKLIKCDLIVRCIMFIILFLSVYFGIVNDYVGYRNGQLTRYALGFNHANRLGGHFLIACMDIFYLYHGKFKKIQWVLFIGMTLITELVADSRAPFVCMILMLMFECYTIIKNKTSAKNNITIIKIICNAALVFSLFISFLLPLLYNYGKLTLVMGNDTIASRIIKAGYALKTYGITLLGQKIRIITIAESILRGTQANGIDNMYVYILVNFGLIFFIGIVILCFVTINYLISIGNYEALTCFTILLIFAIVENPIVKIESNIFLIFLGDAIFNKNKTAYFNANTKIKKGENWYFNNL